MCEIFKKYILFNKNTIFKLLAQNNASRSFKSKLSVFYSRVKTKNRLKRIQNASDRPQTLTTLFFQRKDLDFPAFTR